MLIENIAINKLKPYDKNAKKHDKKQIKQVAESIKRFGFVQPLVADKEGTLIIGHCRLEAAKTLKLSEVPVLRVEGLSDNEVKALRLADNKLNESDWDMPSVIDELRLLDKDLAILTGFDADVFEPVSEDDFDEELPAEPKAKLGDIYKLGEHRLMCGDSTKAEEVAKLLEGERVSMVWTDPPYNIAYEGGMSTHGQNKREMIKNDKMSSDEFYTFLHKAIKNMIENCDGAMYVCMSSSELINLKRAFEDAGGHYQSFLIWAKNTFTLSRSDWQNQYEPILYGWPQKVTNHYFVGHRNIGNVWEDIGDVKPLFENGKTTIKVGEVHLELDGEVTGKIIRKADQVDLWKEKKPTKSTDHPTMKPVKLVARAMRASSQRGDSVLDLFGGGGSTLICAEEMGRKAYIMELDPKYIDSMIARWEKLTGDKATKL